GGAPAGGAPDAGEAQSSAERKPTTDADVDPGGKAESPGTKPDPSKGADA
ncbi:NADH-quinone oxidoreductase subunit NuoE, partial [Cellulosimicrobium cellulans]|nr:NADH-quinone oxidoreductase subunit NuoE [Cellulosimicrobium cellulans]